MKKIFFVLFLLTGIIGPKTSFAVVASKTTTQTEITTDKKTNDKRNGATAAIIGGLFLIVGFVLTLPALKIAFLAAGVVMCIIAIVYLLRTMR